MKKLLFSVILCCSLQSLFAHALWIETVTTGKIGQPQEVKVFLGEYADNQRDSIQNWFSNMTAFTLYLVTPDGQKEALTVVPDGNHFKATFTPKVAGTHVLSIDHTVQAVYGESKIHYYALGLVKVNGSLKGTDNVQAYTDFALLANHSKAPKLHQPEKVQLSYKKAVPAAGEVTVQSPEGWAKKFKTGQQGDITFSPAWPGRYMLEGTYTEATSGQHEGKDFKSVWHCVTYCMDVAK
ncbi:hypothetical protein [Chitinophaga sp. RAB17]|uniref:hypothetical protein n=1 Tax=Chitinophaga sp. RAB17 TaxID=3233049 RepID=UPI003F8EFF2D